MIVPFAAIIDEARSRGAAAPAFTCYDLETTSAVLEVAADQDRGMIVLVSPGSVRGRPGEAFLAALLAFADRSEARACVQVDHLQDLKVIERVLELGAGAVLADGSRLPLDENIAFVREAVSFAAHTSAAVEAELGRVEGDEDLARATRVGQLTDPDEARSFVERSGASCLAVSIGNVHGHCAASPMLDWERLGAIRAAVDVPLALHGASGIAAADVARAIALGIGKINVNTELREAYLRATREAIDAVIPAAALANLHRAQTKAIAAAAREKIAAWDRAGLQGRPNSSCGGPPVK